MTTFSQLLHGSRTRCEGGRLMRHDPQWDDPDLETDIGQCEACSGEGCFEDIDEEDLFE